MTPEDYLLISGIQHFMFCKHQWGLIHIEGVWAENSLTYEGKMLHERADNPQLKESRGSVYYSRSIAVVSHALKMQGVADVIEFTKDRKGIFVEEKGDYYFPKIIEYKRGKPKEGLEDKVQLCALAMAFEEMKNIKLDCGYLYYFAINRRLKVDLDKALRDQVIRLTEEMHFCYGSNITPKPAKIKACKSCSLESICSKNFSEKDAASFNQKIFKEML